MSAPVAARVAVVTGPTSGVGAAVARDLASDGWHVVLVGRRPERLEEKCRAIRRSGGSAEIVVADLLLLADVRRAAGAIRAAVPRVDLLVNNAGAVFIRRGETPEGHERTFALNLLAPFLLTRLLEPSLSVASAPRVVNVASEAHRWVRGAAADLVREEELSGFRGYSRSKLGLILLTREFARRHRDGPTTYLSVHPGFVRSRFGLDNGGAFAFAIRLASVGAISPDRAARNVLAAAKAAGADVEPGAYFLRGHPARPSNAALDEAAGRALFERLEHIVGPVEP